MKRYGCIGMFHTSTRGIVTNVHPLYKKHYDSLGITARATQSEIKNAYYKLSMAYHPDRNQESEAATKFRAITEAYEVLGNVRLKRMYDRGILGNEFDHRRDPRHSPAEEETERPEEPEDPKMKFYRAHPNRSKIPTMDGPKPNYNFEQWNREHYARGFEQHQRHKEKQKTNVLHEQIYEKNTRSESLFKFVLLSGLTFIFLSFILDKDLDHIDVSRKTDRDFIEAMKSKEK